MLQNVILQEVIDFLSLLGEVKASLEFSLMSQIFMSKLLSVLTVADNDS